MLSWRKVNSDGLANYYKVNGPIIKTLAQGIFEELDVQAGIEYLMKYRMSMDVEFI